MVFRGEQMGGEYTKGSRGGRRGNWKREIPSSTPDDAALVIPLEVEPVPTASEEEVLHTTPEPDVVSEEISFSGIKEIPDEILKKLDSLLKSNGGWESTPAPIREALRASGFSVQVVEKGNSQRRGDVLHLSLPQSDEVFTYTTEKAFFLLKEIVSAQRERATLKILEKQNLPPVSEGETQEVGAGSVSENIATPQEEVGEDDGIPVLTDVVSEEELRDEALRNGAQEAAEVRQQIVEDEESVSTRETPPVTIEGEFVQNHHNPEREAMFGDAGIEDAMILKETPKPNIGKERFSKSALVPVDDIPVLTDIVREDEELAPQKEEKSTSAGERPFDARFASEFGVTKEMWEQIPGSEKLSFAQQKLVFENLREFSERDKSPYLKKVWEGIKESLGSEKHTGPILQTLTQLVESAALYGPKVHEENGELLTDFVGLDIPREKRKEWKRTFDALNATAHRMSKTPASWQEDGIGTHSEKESKMMSFMKNTFSPARKRYKEYQEIQASYDAQKKELSRILGEAGYEPGAIAAKLVDIDKNVHMLQFQQTSPDAVEVIKDIPDADMWRMVGKSLCSKSNLGYMASGAVARAAVAGVMGVFAAPAVSAAMAGGRSWDRTAAEMRERDRAARMGTRDTSGEALNIVSAEMTIDIAGEKREVGATQKLQYLIDKYRTLRETNDIEGPPSPRYIKDMNNLLESIRVRASYVEDKQRLNRINFGDKEERPVQMAKLYETLALAQMIVADNSNFPKIDEPIPDWRKDKNPKTLEERLASELSKTENIIQGKRRSRQVKEASWHALRAGTFSYIGGSLVRDLGLEGKLGALMQDSRGVELSPFDEPLLTPEEIARANAGTVPPVGANAANFPYAEDAPMSPNAANFPYAEEAPMAAEHPPYTIRSGDTLTKILKEQMPEIQVLEAGKEQNTAIANILRGLSPEELQSVGIRSGNPDLIFAGDKIDIDALHKIVASHQSIIDSTAVESSTFTPEPLAKTPEIIESATVVPVEAGGFESVLKDSAYVPEISNPDDAIALRDTIWNTAQKDVGVWMKSYPHLNATEAMKAGIVEGHFKSLFGERWTFAGGTNAVDFLEHGPRFMVENPERMTREFRALAEAVAQPPLRIVPTPGEGVHAFLERASAAYAHQGDILPEDSLIRKIEGYYQSAR
jgi:hypothetical protein